MLLGAPGVLNWEGTTIIYRDGINNIPSASRLVQPRTENRAHRRRQRSTAYSDFTLVNIANSIRTTQTIAFELFGMLIIRMLSNNILLWIFLTPQGILQRRDIFSKKMSSYMHLPLPEVVIKDRYEY